MDSGNKWVQDHAAACRAANKPCFFEECESRNVACNADDRCRTDLAIPDGSGGDHCALERPWQRTSVATAGMAGDAFWQHGDRLSFGLTHDDGHTKYYGSEEWTCLVKDHVAAIG